MYCLTWWFSDFLNHFPCSWSCWLLSQSVASLQMIAIALCLQYLSRLTALHSSTSSYPGLIQTLTQFSFGKLFYLLLALHIMFLFSCHPRRLSPNCNQGPRPHQEIEDHRNQRSPSESQYNTAERNIIDRRSNTGPNHRTKCLSIVLKLVLQANHLSCQDCWCDEDKDHSKLLTTLAFILTCTVKQYWLQTQEYQTELPFSFGQTAPRAIRRSCKQQSRYRTQTEHWDSRYRIGKGGWLQCIHLENTYFDHPRAYRYLDHFCSMRIWGCSKVRSRFESLSRVGSGIGGIRMRRMIVGGLRCSSTATVS